MAAATSISTNSSAACRARSASLKQELGGLRTGRASPHLLEPVQVEAYGTHMPLNQLATVSVPEPRLISVQVWDKTMVTAVEKAISMPISALTRDRRTGASACAFPNSTRSAARNSSRSRTNMPRPRAWRCAMCAATAWMLLKKLEKDNKISEDEHTRSRPTVQKATDQSSPKSIRCSRPRKKKS